MSLFWKIFVWFWLAMALICVALLLTISLTESHRVDRHWRRTTGAAVRVYAQTAAQIYERDGQGALVIYLQRVEQTARMPTRIYDENGAEVSGRAATPQTKHLADAAQRNTANDEPLFEFQTEPKAVGFVAQKVYGSTGACYVLVGEVPREPIAWLFPDTRTVLIRIAVLVLIAGLVCYGLARYLAAPVRVLRTQVRRLASGDLSARVGSKIRSAKDELGDLSLDFDRMASQIEMLVLSQRRLLGDISHELRSPLVRLSVALGIVKRRAEVEAPDLIEPLNRIERESERLNDLIGQLLTLTRLETSPADVEETPIDLRDLISQIVVDADFEAQARNCKVEFVNSEECLVPGNVELLRSAIENVVRNGVRYTAENTSVKVTLRCSHDDGALISVRDHGPGVPEEALGDLFRPFYRVADARDRRSGGTGLGLAITERAVRLHGGTITADNAPDEGLVVEITLPATVA